MSWSEEVSAVQNELRVIRVEVESLRLELISSCKGIGEQQIGQMLSMLFEDLENAQNAILRLMY